MSERYKIYHIDRPVAIGYVSEIPNLPYQLPYGNKMACIIPIEGTGMAIIKEPLFYMIAESDTGKQAIELILQRHGVQLPGCEIVRADLD